ncbi:SDR family oxidoreductase [Fulvivirgaceae bacterium BMA12]|uniref:SDR family oxidoreductase n=1 Tax=Agaribacillus aureus TaxID=3051825 RepID=A0ABT8LIE4_9BACT|nr:SDR family oxidoreductase [Fulvivirgaceae bacterium BMA12]
MEIDLKEKRAVVCGSTQGIGKASAIQLSKAGAAITLVARNEEALANVLKELDTSFGQKHEYLCADFSDLAKVRAVIGDYVEKAPKVHILVNNTGGPPAGKAIDAGSEEYQAAFTAHLLCNQFLAQSFVPLMKAEHYGRIINIISTSVKSPIPGLGVSNTIRGAVASWAKTLAGELGAYGITVNNVLPGLTKTARLFSLIKTKAAEANITEEEQTRAMVTSVPVRRLAEPEEVAAAVMFLASPLASYINGINLPVDGGRTTSL